MGSDTVIKKHGKYYADWEDQKGKRHRKAFERARDAKAHTKEMRRQVASKKVRASAR
jgi:hypothetical protein